MALGWSPHLGANYRNYALLGVSMPPPHPRARVAAAGGACTRPALLQRRHNGEGLLCRNSLWPALTCVLQVGLRRAGLLAARAAPDSSAGPVTSSRRGRRKATQPDAVLPGPGGADAPEQGAAGGSSPSNTPAVAEHRQRGVKAASQRLFGSTGNTGSGSSAEETGGKGAVLLGSLSYSKAYLRGTRVLRSAFPQQAAAAAIAAEGGPTKQAVQLHARLPDGQLRPYEVTLCPTGQSTLTICRTRLLAADLGLNEGDDMPLYQLPDGRTVVGGTAAAVGVQQIVSVHLPLRSNRYLWGVNAIRRAFPAQTEAALCSKDPRTVRVYSRLHGGELHPYDLTLRAIKTRTGVSLRLEGILWLVRDLGLQHGDTLQLCVQPDGRVVLEPTHPRPVGPTAITLTEAAIRQGRVIVPLRIATRLLAEDARSFTVPRMVLPVRLDGGRGLMGTLRVYREKNPYWKATGLRRWFVARGASPGDALRLEKEVQVSASAAEGADPSGPHGPAEGPQAKRADSLVARLVHSQEGEEAREGAGRH